MCVGVRSRFGHSYLGRFQSDPDCGEWSVESHTCESFEPSIVQSLDACLRHTLSKDSTESQILSSGEGLGRRGGSGDDRRRTQPVFNIFFQFLWGTRPEMCERLWDSTETARVVSAHRRSRPNLTRGLSLESERAVSPARSAVREAVAEHPRSCVRLGRDPATL